MDRIKRRPPAISIPIEEAQDLPRTESQANDIARRHAHELLDMEFDDVCHQGCFATVLLTANVEDGVIQINTIQPEHRKRRRITYRPKA